MTTIHQKIQYRVMDTTKEDDFWFHCEPLKDYDKAEAFAKFLRGQDDKRTVRVVKEVVLSEILYEDGPEPEKQ